MELYKLTAHELHDKLVNKEVSSVELTNALYARIDEVEDRVKSSAEKTDTEEKDS